MTPEQINVAIAEWCGWKHCEGIYSKQALLNGKMTPLMFNPTTGAQEFVSDYLNDLNAIHEAEKLIKDTRRGQYNAELSKIAAQRNLSSAVKEPEFIFQLLTATAPQRAEALLRTLNLWKDTP